MRLHRKEKLIQEMKDNKADKVKKIPSLVFVFGLILALSLFSTGCSSKNDSLEVKEPKKESESSEKEATVNSSSNNSMDGEEQAATEIDPLANMSFEEIVVKDGDEDGNYVAYYRS